MTDKKFIEIFTGLKRNFGYANVKNGYIDPETGKLKLKPGDYGWAQKPIKDKDEYNKYNLSIILCWLLLPTQRWGSKSLIARFHGCKHKNRVYRLIRFYESNRGFKRYVNEAIKGYKCDK